MTLHRLEEIIGRVRALNPENEHFRSNCWEITARVIGQRMDGVRREARLIELFFVKVAGSKKKKGGAAASIFYWRTNVRKSVTSADVGACIHAVQVPRLAPWRVMSVSPADIRVSTTSIFFHYGNIASINELTYRDLGALKSSRTFYGKRRFFNTLRDIGDTCATVVNTIAAAPAI